MNTDNNMNNLNGQPVNNANPSTPDMMGASPQPMVSSPLQPPVEAQPTPAPVAPTPAPSDSQMASDPNMAVNNPVSPEASGGLASPTSAAPSEQSQPVAPTPQNIPEMTPVQNDMSTVTNVDMAPMPMNVNDMVSPTNLEQTDISTFGQEGIPLNNINQNPKPSSLASVPKSDEYNNIGSVPENAHVEQKPKKQLNMKFVLLMAILLIVLVGVGIFVYLRMGNKASAKITAKNVKVQLSDTISTNVSDYVASGKIDSSCVANFDDVQANKIGKYTYKIICNSGTVTGTIEVVDEVAPTAITKIVFKTVGEEITENDFVESCNDISNCALSFVDADTVKGYTATPGTYEVAISAKDDFDNAKEYATFLIVTETEVSKNLVCTSKDIENADEGYNYNIKDTIGIIINNGLITNAGFTIRDYTISYSTDEAFNTAKSTIKEDGTIETSIANGKATFSENDKTITIKKLMTTEELTSEFETYPEDYNGLRTMYQNNDKEFECVINSN